MSFPLRPVVVSAVVGSLVIACGGSTAGPGNGATGGGDDGGAASTDSGMTANDSSPTTSEDSSGYAAPHPSLPIVKKLSGPTMPGPVLVPVIYTMDPNADSEKSFVTQLVSSSYWTEATAEYGIGQATAGTPVMVSGALPSKIEAGLPGGTPDCTTVQGMLGGAIGAYPSCAPSSPYGKLAPSPNTVFLMFFPPTTTVTLSQGGQVAKSCSSFEGFHMFVPTADNGFAPYAIIPQCDLMGLPQGFAEQTICASHETIEAVTDPTAIADQIGWGMLDDDDVGAYFTFPFGGVEIGDMCAQPPQNYIEPTGLPFTVQRVWSDNAAMSGQDPCVPSNTDTVPYFNSGVVVSDELSYTDPYGGQHMTKGIKASAGQSKTVDVQLFSYGPTESWQIQAIDAAELKGQSPTLQFAWDSQAPGGKNGTVLHLTVTPTKSGPTAFVLLSQIDSTHLNLWPVYVSAD